MQVYAYVTFHVQRKPQLKEGIIHHNKNKHTKNCTHHIHTGSIMHVYTQERIHRTYW